ncbi:MAG: von Willebrand factor type A domain-containing protein, partial [Verrucomicrobiales bacterium]|nr:von Willebrand factor type A domain-containing protein [Verrucomicrobiales bacterium]
MNRPLSELTREELEAKVTALVLGELDAAEAASMEALLARDAALAEWKRTLESALESVREAARTPAEPLSDVPVAHRMSEPRRSTLLERLRQADAAGASREASEGSETSPAARGFDRPDAGADGGSVIVPFPRSRAYGLLAAAAGLVVLLGWATWNLENSTTSGAHFALSDPEGSLLRETSTRYRRTFGWQWGTNSSEAQWTQDQPIQAAGSGGARDATAGVDKLEAHSVRFGKAATAGQSEVVTEGRMEPRTLSRGRPAVAQPPPPAAVTARRYTLAPKPPAQEQPSPLAIAGNLAANGRPVLGDVPQVGRLLKAEASPPSPTRDVAAGSSAGGRAATHFYSNAGVPVPSALSSIEAKTKSDNQPAEAVDARRDAAPVELHFRAELMTSEDSLRVLSEDRALAQDRGGAFDALSDGVPVSRLTDLDRAAGKQAALGTRLEAVRGAVLEPEILRKAITLSRANPIPELEEAVGEVDTAGRPEVAQVESLSRKAVNPEVATAEVAVSTFSLNVSDASFRSVDAWLGQGQPVDANAVRAEEFLNAFEYRDPLPAPGARVGFTWERARHPFAHQRDLIRMAVRTAATGREPGRPFNVVLLLDASGSMERPDRLATVRAALGELAKVLGPGDRVSVVAFARTARVWVDGLAGEQAGELPARVGELLPEGGTNLEEALRVAYETARRHFQPQGENHVVLLTDGVTNLGEQRAEVLRAGIESERRRGIALDCFGIGLEGLGDAL